MLAVLLAVALAQAPPVGPGEAFHDALAHAKQAAWDGEYETAEAALQALADRLDRGEDPGDVLASEALLHLGDAQFVLGRKDDARATFRRVLEGDPDHTMSPYDHGEDVRALFALVREEVLRDRPLPPPPPQLPTLRAAPLRPMHFLPFGAPQAHQRRRSARQHAFLQGGLAVGSLATFVVLDVVNRPPDRRPSWTPEQVTAARFGVQIPLTAAFYAAWAWSVGDGLRHRRDHPVVVEPEAPDAPDG